MEKTQPKVIISGEFIEEPIREKLEESCQLLFTGGRPPTPEELKDASGWIVPLTQKINEGVLSHGPKLRVLANYAVGYDNIDVAACSARKIAVANTPGVLTEATADMAFALLLATARRVVEGDTMVREGRWQGFSTRLLLGAGLGGKTLGILGFGRIGRAVARRARGFGLKVLYSSPRAADPSVEAALSARRVSFLELCQTSDFLVIACRLTEETRGLFSREVFATLKRGAILINIARGEIVDTEALIEALSSKHLAGAGLDVYDQEPMVDPRLRVMPQTVLTPHLGSATREAREGMARLCAEAIFAVLIEGKLPQHLVNPEAFLSQEEL